MVFIPNENYIVKGDKVILISYIRKDIGTFTKGHIFTIKHKGISLNGEFCILEDDENNEILIFGSEIDKIKLYKE